MAFQGPPGGHIDFDGRRKESFFQKITRFLYNIDEKKYAQIVKEVDERRASLAVETLQEEVK